MDKSYVERFRNWIELNKIRERTVQSFWDFYEHYKNEDQESFTNDFGANLNEDLFEIVVETISLSISQVYESSLVYINSYIPIIYDGVDIGTYKLIFSLDGQVEDDYFSIEESWKSMHIKE